MCVYNFILIDVCLSGGRNMCRNGGSCIVDENGKVGCLCAKEHSGIFCEQGNIIPVDQCGSK